jgi:hypothetical protein
MTRLSDDLAGLLDKWLADADRMLRELYPGDSGTRQPVHTVYIPADRFSPDAHRLWGAQAVELLDRHAPTAERLAEVTGMPVPLVNDVYDRVRAKLTGEPVEDLRVDFEDGYGQRSDEEEDRAAGEVAAALAAAARAEDGPPFVGIRFKSFEAPTRRRGLRTLDLVVTGLLASGGLPEGFVVTLPKVTSMAQIGWLQVPMTSSTAAAPVARTLRPK